MTTEEKQIEAIVSELLSKLVPDFTMYTPKAVAKMYLSLLDGYGDLDVKKTFPLCFEYDGPKKIIQITHIRFYTFCEHHMLPFFGFVHYAYIPSFQIIGLSKPARIVEHFSHRLQTQEILTDQIDEALWDIVKPVAHIVETEAVHLCSIMRGVRTPDESVNIRNERVNENIYQRQEGKGHLYHLIKDLLAMTFKQRDPIKHL